MFRVLEMLNLKFPRLESVQKALGDLCLKVRKRDPVNYSDLETFIRKMKMNCNENCQETKKSTYTRANKNVQRQAGGQKMEL